MRRRQGILGALSAIAAGVTGLKIDPTKAAFINSDLEAKCAAIRGLFTFEDFWGDDVAMHAYVHKDDPCQHAGLHPVSDAAP